MKNLISMTDFVFLMRENKDKDNIRRFWVCEKYAKFLKQPLELWMFIPCDEEGEVLEEKSIFNPTDEDYIFDSESFDKYQKAKERCLFEGFEINQHEECVSLIEDYAICFDVYEFNKKTIEDLIQYDLILTPTAIKQLGL